MKISTIIVAFIIVLVWNLDSCAWEKHQEMMPWIVEGLQSTLSAHDKEILTRKVSPPCGAKADETYRRLAVELGLNTNIHLPEISAEACSKNLPLTPLDILTSVAVDEPDLGMDRDLDASYDPKGERKWMGGVKGPTSQGFRHMYFAGTFQIPLHPIGQAPERVELMALKARALIRSGDLAWGFRVLAWAIHYSQDLTEPFHTMQIPTFKMVPWMSVLSWPPARGFDDLLSETTRVVANYHWAYEHYVLFRIQSDNSTLVRCFSQGNDGPMLEPKKLVLKMARISANLAPEIGRMSVLFFGRKLKEKEVNLPQDRGTLNFQEYATRPDFEQERDKLEKQTCPALANAATASRRLIEWALLP